MDTLTQINENTLQLKKEVIELIDKSKLLEQKASLQSQISAIDEILNRFK